MTTNDVVQAFLIGETKGKASGGRLYIDGDKLINYGTVIAQRVDGVNVVNATKYSPTTTKHQTRLLRSMPEVKTLVDIPMGTACLKSYLTINAQ